MIAGMYEDVSAVLKGWKLNPIAFDSVLNQSSHSFAFGSPDIVPMFAVGAAADRVDMWTYNEEDEDFTKDATHLDLWVLDRFKALWRTRIRMLRLVPRCVNQARSSSCIFSVSIRPDMSTDRFRQSTWATRSS